MKLFKIFGIEIKLDFSLSFIFGLIVYMLVTGYFPQKLPNLSFAMYLASSILTALLFFISILFHELAHSLMARKFHIRVKGITLFMFGGVAEMEANEGFKSPWSEFLISIVGPLSSFVLAGIFFGLAWLSSSFLWLALALMWLVNINILFALFNLLIFAFPMDGGRIFRSFCWWLIGDIVKATKIAKYVTLVFSILLPIGGYFWGGWFSAIWLGFIAWMILLPAARTEYLMVFLRGKEVRVRQAMESGSWAGPVPRPEIICGPEELALTVLMRMNKIRRTTFLVMENGNAIGIISFKSANQYVDRNSK